jgi:hypothetical protein
MVITMTMMVVVNGVFLPCFVSNVNLMTRNKVSVKVRLISKFVISTSTFITAERRRSFGYNHEQDHGG